MVNFGTDRDANANPNAQAAASSPSGADKITIYQSNRPRRTTLSAILGVATRPVPHHAVIAGGAAGDFAVAGILTTDRLDEVLYFVGAGTSVTDVSDLTSEFTITGAGTINNTGGTASTGGKLVVRYTRNP